MKEITYNRDGYNWECQVYKTRYYANKILNKRYDKNNYEIIKVKIYYNEGKKTEIAYKIVPKILKEMEIHLE